MADDDQEQPPASPQVCPHGADQQHPTASLEVSAHVADSNQPPAPSPILPDDIYSPIRDSDGTVKKLSPWPPWLVTLLNEEPKFFQECRTHVRSHCSCYCLLCMNGPLCPACLAAHHNTHNSLMIRRACFRCAVRVDDIKDLVDISSVETDLREGDFHLIVYFNKSGTTPDENAVRPCLACHLKIRPQFSFCSINCMVAGPSEDLPKNNEEQSGEQEKAATNSEISSSEQGGLGSKRGNSSPSSPGPAKRQKGSPHEAS